MKIVIFSDTFPPDINGVATSCLSLFTCLKENGEEVLFITSNSSKAYKSTYSSSLIRLKGVRFKLLYNYVISGFVHKKAMKIIEEFSPDVCHIQTDGPLGQMGFKAAKKLDVAAVYTYHTCLEDYTYYFSHGWFFDKTSKKVVRKYTKHIAGNSDEIIVPSDKVLSYMETLGLKEKISVIPTGFDFSPFYEENKEETEKIKESLGIGKNDYVLLYFGRLAKEKSIDELIYAFKDYVSINGSDSVKFVIAGGGPDLKRLKSLSESLSLSDKVIFTDRVEPEDAPNYYHLGDLYLFSSSSETQGLTYLEAMASGLPVLVKEDESNKNVIRDNENGFVYSLKEELPEKSERIRTMDKRELERIVRNGYKALEPFTKEMFYSSVMKAYEMAIKEHERKKDNEN